MSSHAEKAVAVAGKVTAMAEDGLDVLDRTIGQWPAEFQAIMWDAVAEIAYRRAALARSLSDNRGSK